MNFSCQYCEKKHGGCHADCDTYKQEKKAYDEKMAVLRQERDIQNGLYAQRDRRIRAAIRRAKNARKWFV